MTISAAGMMANEALIKSQTSDVKGMSKSTTSTDMERGQLIFRGAGGGVCSSAGVSSRSRNAAAV